jgi:hypothetical protein
VFSLDHLRTAMNAASERLRGGSGSAHLQALCESLVDDVAAPDRKALLERLPRLRRADDLPQLRTGIFEVLSHHHGEEVARDRLALLDTALDRLPQRGSRRPTSPESARGA